MKIKRKPYTESAFGSVFYSKVVKLCFFCVLQCVAINRPFIIPTLEFIYIALYLFITLILHVYIVCLYNYMVNFLSSLKCFYRCIGKYAVFSTLYRMHVHYYCCALYI